MEYEPVRTTTEQVLELAEVYEQMRHFPLREANRKSKRNRKSEPRRLSHNPSYITDLDNYKDRDDVIALIKEIEERLKNREDAYLASNHDAHALHSNLKGKWSLKLYPGGQDDKDILIVYKFHENKNHVAFYNIGNHKHIYKKKKRK